MKLMKKTLSLLLAAMLLAGLMQTAAFAALEPVHDLPAVPADAGTASGDAPDFNGLPAVPPADGGLALDAGMSVDPVSPDGGSQRGEDDGGIGDVELDENGQVPFDAEDPYTEIVVDNSWISEEFLNQPASRPSGDMLERMDSAMGVAPAAVPMPIKTAAFSFDDQLSFEDSDYTHWVRNGVISMGGVWIGNDSGQWYTYCIDQNLAYPSAGSRFINLPRASLEYTEHQLMNYACPIALDNWYTFDDSRLLFRDSGKTPDQEQALRRALNAGYPLEAVASVRAAGDQTEGGLSPEYRAFWTQGVIWAVLNGDQYGLSNANAYTAALYDYAMNGSDASRTDLVIEEMDGHGQITLSYDGVSDLWTGTVTLQSVPSDLTLSSVSEGVTVYADGVPLQVGGPVETNVLTLQADSDLKGQLSFSYNVRENVGEDLTLFETDACLISTGRNINKPDDLLYLTSATAYQPMLGFQVSTLSDTATAMILGVNQPTPEQPEDPQPQPTPQPETPPTPSAPAPDDDGGEGYQPGEGPGAAPVELPEEETPLAQLPVEEAPVLEDLPEETVPLAEAPQTGDASLLWAAAALLSLTGLGWLALSSRKRTDR